MSAKSIVYQALINDMGVTNLVAADNINQQWFDSVKGLPQITITRVNEVGIAHGNNIMLIRETPIQVDIWVGTDKSSTPIELEVKRVLLTVGTNPLVGLEGIDPNEPIIRVSILTNINEITN